MRERPIADLLAKSEALRALLAATAALLSLRAAQDGVRSFDGGSGYGLKEQSDLDRSRARRQKVGDKIINRNASLDRGWLGSFPQQGERAG